MNKCIDSIGIVQQKEDYERRIQEWMNKDGTFQGRTPISTRWQKRDYEKSYVPSKTFTYLWESFGRTNEFCTRAFRVNYGMPLEAIGRTILRNNISCLRIIQKNGTRHSTKKVFAAMLKNYKEQVDAEYLPEFYKVIQTKFNNNYTAYVDYLYKKSFLMKSGKKIYANKKSFQKDLVCSSACNSLRLCSDCARR